MTEAGTISDAGGGNGGWSGEADDWLFARVPDEVRKTFTTEQRSALRRALAGGDIRHPVNIRVSVPLPGRRAFLTLIAGEERRNLERRARDRAHHPLRTLGNIVFFIGIGALFYVLAVGAIVLQSAIVEF